jgi:hypothetical protein
MISLISGAVTAAGLSAIYLQFRETNRQASVAIRDEALRIDQFYAEFISQPMHKWRSDAWIYLEFLCDNREAKEQFSRWWIGEDVKPPKIVGKNRRCKKVYVGAIGDDRVLLPFGTSLCDTL